MSDINSNTYGTNKIQVDWDKKCTMANLLGTSPFC